MNTLIGYILSWDRIGKQYLCFFLLAAGLLTVSNVRAQTEKEDEDIFKQSRKYLIDQLVIYYVENPNSESGEAIKLDNAAIAKGIKEGAFWTDSTRLVYSLVEELLCEDEELYDGGNSTLQYDAAWTMKILNKPVQLWIYNDQKPLNDYALGKYAPCTDSLGHVLPCATTFRKENKQSDLWAGFIHLGTKNQMREFDAQSSLSGLYDSLQLLRSRFIHLLMHTQDHSDIDLHELQICETHRRFSLGEKDHFFVRAVPNLTLAYQEGIANNLSMSLHQYEVGSAFKWFENNEYLLVETLIDSADRDFEDKTWLYQQIREVAGEGDTIPSMPHYRGYRIRDLPPKFMMYNEFMISLMIQVSNAKYKEALAKTHAEMADPYTSFNPLATLVKYLSEGELPAGETVISAFKLLPDAPKPHLKTLAFVDYYTAFKAQNKEEFAEIFDDELPQPWIDLYWDTAMEKVRKAVPAPETQPEEQSTTPKPFYDLVPKIYEVNIKAYEAIAKVLYLPE